MRKHIRTLSLVLSSVMLFNAAAPAMAATFAYRVPLKGAALEASEPLPETPATGAGSLAFMSSALALNTTVGRAVSGLLTVENKGTAEVRLGTATVTGSSDLTPSTNCNGATLPAQGTCGISVTYTGASQGTTTGTVSISGVSARVTAVTSSASTSARVASVTPSAATIRPNGAYGTTLSAVVTDPDGRPVAAGVAVTWATTLGQLAAYSSNTNSQGVATASLRASVTGIATVSAVGPTGVAKTTSVNVAADPTVSRVTAVTATPRNGILADNASISVVKATVKDSANTNAGPGHPVTWTASKGTLSATTTYTDADGEATVELKSGAVGTASVTAVGPSGTSRYTLVSFVADAASARVVTWSPSAPYVAANGTAIATLTLKVLDGYGNILPTQKVTYSTNLGTLSKTSGGTNTSGMETLTIKSATEGTAEVLVTLGSTGEVMALNVGFVFPPEKTSIDSFIIESDRIPANGKSKSVVRARIVDGNGNPYPYGLAMAYFNVISGSGTVLTSIYADSNGWATTTFSSSVYISTVQLRAQNQARTVSLFGTVTTVGDLETAQVYQVLSNASPKANGVATSTVTVIARDGTNNNTEGLTVYLSSTIGTLADTVLVTGADGRATTTITSTTVGTGQIYAHTGRGETPKYANISFIK